MRNKYKFSSGDVVMWRDGWGIEDPVQATVIKDGEPHKGDIAYDLDNGHWAYEYQLEKISEG